LKSHSKTISQNWSPNWVAVLRATFGSLPWRSRSQHDHAAKTWSTHKFVIWSRILQLFDRNDHHIEMMCHFVTLPIDKWNNNKMLTHKQQCSPIYKTFPITRSIIVEIQHSMWVDYWSDNSIAIDCHSKTWKPCCRGLGCCKIRHVSRIKDAIIIAKTLHLIFNYK